LFGRKGMAHIAVFCLPMPSHLRLFLALSQALASRGHHISFFGVSETRRAIEQAGFDFYLIDSEAMPSGTFTALTEGMGKTGALAGMRLQGHFDELRYSAQLEQAPAIVRRIGLDGLVVDQSDASGGSIAEAVRLPWITVSSGLSMNVEPGMPPQLTSWNYASGPFAQLRNRLFYSALHIAGIRTRQIINGHRERWGLPRLRRIDDTFSPFAQISQQNQEFDFPRKELPKCFHYVGPIHAASRPSIPFPWEALNGRPLLYASLGTVNQQKSIYERIAEACAGLDVQLVLSLGGAAEVEQFQNLAGSPLVVKFAPQVEVLERAALCITHGGLNSTLESLGAGVPLVAIPINFDQFGVAARIRWTGTGEFVKQNQLTAARLRSAIQKVLAEAHYTDAARRMRDAIAGTNGAEEAADIIEEVVRTGKPALRG
jgi:zeaxanthin glucosyltransferase